MPESINTVAIVGLGLIGGSFGLALRQAGFRGDIIGVDDPTYTNKALKLGAITKSTTSLDEIAVRSDLIYLAHKVDYICELLDLLGPIARAGCLITDSGSTKAVITEKAGSTVKFAEFVGGHPMAGKEKRGIENADASLFRGRPYILTTVSKLSPVVNEFIGMLTAMGADVVHMSAIEHDSAVAFTSHLPQLLSTALANTLLDCNQKAFTTVFGPGLIDMTRLALSPSDLWISILDTNKSEVIKALDSYIKVLDSVREKLILNDIGSLFTSASAYARQLREGTKKV